MGVFQQERTNLEGAYLKKQTLSFRGYRKICQGMFIKGEKASHNAWYFICRITESILVDQFPKIFICFWLHQVILTIGSFYLRVMFDLLIKTALSWWHNSLFFLYFYFLLKKDIDESNTLWSQMDRNTMFLRGLTLVLLFLADGHLDSEHKFSLVWRVKIKTYVLFNIKEIRTFTFL